jgi:S1-C subfamily serine protease
VASTPVGKEVSIRILRDGKEMDLRVKVGEMKEEKQA